MEILTLETEGIKTTLNIDPTDIELQIPNIETTTHDFIISVTEMFYDQTIDPTISFRIELDFCDITEYSLPTVVEDRYLFTDPDTMTITITNPFTFVDWRYLSYTLLYSGFEVEGSSIVLADSSGS